MGIKGSSNNFEVIRDYYSKALGYIQINKSDLATKILYKEMPVDLYDLSLDILFNKNEDFKDNDLRELIHMVDGLLNQSSRSEETKDLRDINEIF